MRLRGIPTHVLVCPDKFKGSFSAGQVAAALVRGLAASGQPAESLPVADGGEGTLRALTHALALERVPVTVSDPLGRPVAAEFGLAPDGVAVVEMALASGLALLEPGELDPLAASTRGTGELIAAAISAGAREVHVAVGGSATTDGGEGAVQALRAAGGLGGAKLNVLCDVRTSFGDAARVFAPQKGADAEAVAELSARLGRQAAGYPRNPLGVPMTGAAGGLAGGLWAWFDARLVAGAAFVLDALGYDARMRAARAVVAGEGRLDRQSLAGKALAEVATRARQAGVPCHAVVGRNALDRFDARILDLQLVLEASTLAQIEAAGVELAQRLRWEHDRAG